MSPEMMNIIDLGFALGFAGELGIRRSLTKSWGSFYCTHEDASWHLFDTVVVGSSLFSFILSQSVSDDEEGGGAVFSLFRLLRILRLARVARFFRVFKQLTIMLMSLFDGMKTLVWAAMLLILILYMLAILVVFTNEELIHSLRDTPHSKLVESLPMVMYVLFECMSEGCGNNIVRPLVEETGVKALVLAFYPLFTVFTVFGVLNLFTAMFVDNTMEAARVNEDRFRQARDKQSKVLAAKIQKLVATMLGDEANGHMEDGEDGEALDAEAMTGEILTKDMFTKALTNPEVRKLLSEMDISDTDHVVLFDVLDADGSGNLSVAETVQGLVQVQAPARALDIVAVRLGMRAMQRQLKDQLAEQKDAFDRLTAELSALRADQKEQGSHLKRLSSQRWSSLASDISNPDILQKLKAASAAESPSNATSAPAKVPGILQKLKSSSIDSAAPKPDAASPPVPDAASPPKLRKSSCCSIEKTPPEQIFSVEAATPEPNGKFPEIMQKNKISSIDSETTTSAAATPSRLRACCSTGDSTPPERIFAP
jgi:hypothetical protein